MKREIRIDLLEIDEDSFNHNQNDPQPPAGVSIKGPFSTTLACVDAPSVPMFLLVRIMLPITTKIAASYIYEHLFKHGAKRIRIDHEEIDLNRGEVERIIRTKIEITE